MFFSDVEIPKYVDNVTPEYKPKFDKLVRAPTIFPPTLITHNCQVYVDYFYIFNGAMGKCLSA